MASGQRTNTDYWPQVVRFKDIIIRIWHHTISCQHGESNIPYWTYVSYGMSTVNQPDLVVTLRRRLSESEGNYSIEPLSWFKMVYLWGKKGRKIDVYHTQEAHFDHWLGSKKLETVTYGMPIQLPGFGPGVLPHNRVHGIALTSQESELAKLFGYTRVVGHLGWGVRWFPYPPWIDRDRDDSIVRAQTDKTIRRDFFPVFKKIKGTSARREGSRIILEFLPNSEDAVLSAIPDSTAEAVAFDSHLHPNATACYTWQKGNKDMMLYGYSDEIIGLCFVALCPQQTIDHYNIVEDGSSIFLRDQTWLKVREALKKGRDITIPLQGTNGYQPATLEFRFLQTTYNYPPAGLEISLETGFVKKWQSRNPKWLTNSAIRLDRIAMNPGFHPDPTTKPSIVRLMEQIGNSLAAAIPKKPRRGTSKCIMISLQVPGASPVDCIEFSSSPDLNGIDAKAIWDQFRKLRIPDESEISEFYSVRMFFAVWE